jgi:uncharacterized cupredoxin-like copper-binding protein
MNNVMIILAIVFVAGAVVAAVLLGGGRPTQAPTTVQVSTSTTITLTEYALTPSSVIMDHGRVKLTIVNNGKVIHDFILHDPVDNKDIGKLTKFLKPGTSEIIWVDLIAFRRYEMYDPTYRDKGMQGSITAR